MCWACGPYAGWGVLTILALTAQPHPRPRGAPREEGAGRGRRRQWPGPGAPAAVPGAGRGGAAGPGGAPLPAFMLVVPPPGAPADEVSHGPAGGPGGGAGGSHRAGALPTSWVLPRGGSAVYRIEAGALLLPPPLYPRRVRGGGSHPGVWGHPRSSRTFWLGIQNRLAWGRHREGLFWYHRTVQMCPPDCLELGLG